MAQLSECTHFLFSYLLGVVFYLPILSGQIIATSHDLGPQKAAEEGKYPYFREFHVAEILMTLVYAVKSGLTVFHTGLVSQISDTTYRISTLVLHQ